MLFHLLREPGAAVIGHTVVARAGRREGTCPSKGRKVVVNFSAAVRTRSECIRKGWSEGTAWQRRRPGRKNKGRRLNKPQTKREIACGEVYVQCEADRSHVSDRSRGSGLIVQSEEQPATYGTGDSCEKNQDRTHRQYSHRSCPQRTYPCPSKGPMGEGHS